MFHQLNVSAQPLFSEGTIRFILIYCVFCFKLVLDTFLETVRDGCRDGQQCPHLVTTRQKTAQTEADGLGAGSEGEPVGVEDVVDEDCAAIPSTSKAKRYWVTKVLRYVVASALTPSKRMPDGQVLPWLDSTANLVGVTFPHSIAVTSCRGFWHTRCTARSHPHSAASSAWLSGSAWLSKIASLPAGSSPAPKNSNPSAVQGSPSTGPAAAGPFSDSG